MPPDLASKLIVVLVTLVVALFGVASVSLSYQTRRVLAAADRLETIAAQLGLHHVMLENHNARVIKLEAAHEKDSESLTALMAEHRVRVSAGKCGA